MKKNVGFLLWILLSIFIASCTDVYREADSEKEKERIPPGNTYTPEKETYNLNVVYYVPSDVVEIEDWHYRLSGFTLHIQNYFYENFMRFRVDRKFGLELNDANPEYVKIHYIKSKRSHLDMQERNISEMTQEILDYFEQHPDTKQSDHYLVYMPKYDGSFIKHYFPSTKEGFAFCGVDNTRWKVSYFESARARAVFIPQLGYVLKTFAQSCFLPESNAGFDSPFMALMGAERDLVSNQPVYNCKNYSGSAGTSGTYTPGTPDKVRLMIWDVRYLAGTQLFNDDYSYEPFEVNIQDVQIASKEGVLYSTDDTLHVKCRFSCPVDLAGVLLLDDPWRTYHPVSNKLDVSLDKDGTNETGWDAYGVYVEAVNFKKEGDVYEADFVLALGNHLNFPLKPSATTIIDHELRFRFIGKHGMAYPHAPTSIKGDFTDTPLRGNIYTIKLAGKVDGYQAFYHDIPTRYGTWVGVLEEE